MAKPSRTRSGNSLRRSIDSASGNERRSSAADHYTYRISWSDEDQEFLATCAEFPSLSHLAGEPDEALRSLRRLVRDVVADMQAGGEPAPQPLAEQQFSGRFVARIPNLLHRRLAIEAAEAGISLNRLVSFKLAMPAAASAPPTHPRRRTRLVASR